MATLIVGVVLCAVDYIVYSGCMKKIDEIFGSFRLLY